MYELDELLPTYNYLTCLLIDTFLFKLFHTSFIDFPIEILNKILTVIKKYFENPSCEIRKGRIPFLRTIGRRSGECQSELRLHLFSSSRRYWLSINDKDSVVIRTRRESVLRKLDSQAKPRVI